MRLSEQRYVKSNGWNCLPEPARVGLKKLYEHIGKTGESQVVDQVILGWWVLNLP